MPSILFWGPPGSGKTTLARLIATVTRSCFEPVSAVSAGVADLRKAVAGARERQTLYQQPTILFVDEIHRFNKAQQDVILPHVEDGTITFIGATTENPSFEVNAPLLSRCRVFTLRALDGDAVAVIIQRALQDDRRGLGNLSPHLEPDALAHLVNIANGDARVALNALEMAVVAAEPGHLRPAPRHSGRHRRRPCNVAPPGTTRPATATTIRSPPSSNRSAARRPTARSTGLARMLEAGEDPMFIARRLVILAAEDIGLANPGALPVAVAAQQAVHFVGLPEGRIPLAEATVYLATSPKSNAAYMALERALADVRGRPHEPVPMHLRNAVTGLMRGMGYGAGYKYSHDYEGHFEAQEYLPPELSDRKYYEPTDQGSEAAIAERLRRWWGDARYGGQGDV